jgi:hypothetical protein
MWVTGEAELLRKFSANWACYIVIVVAIFAFAGQSGAQEAPVGRAALGFGYNRNAGVSIVGEFQHRALMGRDQSIDLAFAVSSREQNYSLDYRLGGLGDGNPTFGVAASHAELDRSERMGVETTVSWLAPAMVWELGAAGSASFGPVFVHDELRASTHAPLMLQAEAGTRSLVGLALEADLLMQDVGLGFRAAVLDDGDDLRYARAEVSVDYALPLAPGALSSGIAIRGGAISVARGQTALSDRFLPPSGAIRGFEANGFGPMDSAALGGARVGATRYAVMSFDARYAGLLSAAPNVVFGLFMDVGSAWGLDVAGDSDRAAIDADAYWRGAAGLTIGQDFGAARLELVLGDAFAHRSSDQVQNVQLNFASNF